MGKTSDPNIVLNECHEHYSGSSLSIAQKLTRLKPNDSERILQEMFQEARQTKQLFDHIQELAVCLNTSTAALKCCKVACSHLNAQVASVVQTPIYTVKEKSIATSPAFVLSTNDFSPPSPPSPPTPHTPPSSPPQDLYQHTIHIPIALPCDRNKITTKIKNNGSNNHNPNNSAILSSAPAALANPFSSFSPWSILIHWSSFKENIPCNNIKRSKQIDRIYAAAAVVGQLQKRTRFHRKVSSKTSASSLTRHEQESRLLVVKAQMIACVDEKSLFHLISTQGPLFVSMDSCHLFLRNQRSLNINFSSPNTKRKHSLRKSPKIQLRTRADTGGKLYNVPGIPRAPERLELTRKKNDNKVNNHDTKEATINEKYRWGAGGEIICHLQRSEQCSRQSFPSVEHIQGGLPVAAVQQGNNFVIRVEDSLQMNQYLSTDPVWGLSPRLAATLDGDMAAKRMSVLAVALKSGQGAVRFARYSHNLTEATAATAATAATTATTATTTPATAKPSPVGSFTIQPFRAKDENSLRLFAGAIDEVVQLTLLGQQAKDEATALLRKANFDLASIGSTRSKHKRLMEAFETINKTTSTTKSICMEVADASLYFVTQLFGNDIPEGGTASSTVFCVKPNRKGKTKANDLQHATTKSSVGGSRNHTWLHQSAEQCARLQKPVFYSNANSNSFPATACFPLSLTNSKAFVVCLCVSFVSDDKELDTENDVGDYDKSEYNENVDNDTNSEEDDTDGSTDDDDNDKHDDEQDLTGVNDTENENKKTMKDSSDSTRRRAERYTNKKKIPHARAASIHIQPNKHNNDVGNNNAGGYNFNKRPELRHLLNQIVNFGQNILCTKKNNKNLQTQLSALQWNRESKLTQMTTVLRSLVSHQRNYFDNKYNYKSSRTIHLKKICELVVVQMNADHVQLYITPNQQDLSPETSLACQSPVMALSHTRIPRTSSFARATQLSKKNNAEFLADGAILAASKMISNAPRLWFLAERFADGIANGTHETYTLKDCAQLCALASLALEELSNINSLDTARISCIQGQSTLDVTQLLTAGVQDAAKPLRTMLRSLRGSTKVDTVGFFAVGTKPMLTRELKHNKTDNNGVDGDEDMEKKAEEDVFYFHGHDSGEMIAADEPMTKTTTAITTAGGTYTVPEKTNEIKHGREETDSGRNEENVSDQSSSSAESAGNSLVKKISSVFDLDKELDTTAYIDQGDLFMTCFSDTLPQTMDHTFEGLLSNTEEFSFLLHLIEEHCNTNLKHTINGHTYICGRDSTLLKGSSDDLMDELLDHRTPLEHWFKDYISFLKISPVVVKGVIAGFVVLVDSSRNDSNVLENRRSSSRTTLLMGKNYDQWLTQMIGQMVEQAFLRKVMWNTCTSESL